MTGPPAGNDGDLGSRIVNHILGKDSPTVPMNLDDFFKYAEMMHTRGVTRAWVEQVGDQFGGTAWEKGQVEAEVGTDWPAALARNDE